jgi:hypothetical protein
MRLEGLSAEEWHEELKLLYQKFKSNLGTLENEPNLDKVACMQIHNAISCLNFAQQHQGNYAKKVRER